MAVATSRPSGRRSDDVRALRFRFRTVTFSGNYPTGGETIQAKDLSLKRILAVIPLNSLIRASAGAVTGSLPVFDIVASSGGSAGGALTIRHLRDAAGAANSTVGAELTNGTAYPAGSSIDIMVIGE